MNVRTRNLLRMLPVIIALMLSALACEVSMGDDPEKTVEPQSPETAPSGGLLQSGVAEKATPVPAATKGFDIQRLERATVQIFAYGRPDGGALQAMWTGSGTVVTPDGLILTNAHVASPHSPGVAGFYQDPQLLLAPDVEELRVAFSPAEDQKPEVRYLADVVASDGVLDLAVIRITRNLDGNFVDSQALKLDYVPLGDSDQVHIGDKIHVFGYPGAGGETITYTQGTVSGFEDQPRVETNRAFIKTDSNVSPGNSGGLATNENGQIIGVPTWVFEAQGGGINRLRAINLAKPLIDAALRGQAYNSPYEVRGSGQENFDLVSWAQDFSSEDGCPIGRVNDYQSGTPAIVSVFSFSGMSEGQDVVYAFYRNDEMISLNVFPWDASSSGNCYPFYYYANGDSLPDGDYAIELYAGEDFPLVGSAMTSVGGSGGVSGGSGTAAAGGVTVDGFIMDADSGRPIEGAVLIVLNPGVDIDAFRNDPRDADVYTFASTDSDGYFILPKPLQYGIVYPALAGAYDQGYRTITGELGYDDPSMTTDTLSLGLSR